jgi:hypothetical protein
VAAATPLDQEVIDFAVAPGGEWLMYRTHEFVSISAIYSQSGQIISWTSAPPPASPTHKTMAWSPDASKVAYSMTGGFEVFVPGAGPNAEPLVFTISEAPIRQMAWSDDGRWLLLWREDNSTAIYESTPDVTLWVELGDINGYVWLRDGRLAFAPAEGGLALLDPADLESRVFMVSQDRTVSLPGQRPDGALVFFVHQGSIDQPGTLHVGDPDDLSFHQESSVQVNTRFQMWNPVVTRLIGLDPDDEPSRLIITSGPGDSSTASFEARSTPTLFDWGDPPPQSVTGLTPNDLCFLAPVAGVIQIWRLPKTGEAPEVLADVSTPLRIMMFRKWHSGCLYQWRCHLSQIDWNCRSHQIATLNTHGPIGNTSGTPAFSPSGRQIAFANRGIWIYDLDAGQTRRLVSDTIPTDPQRANEIIIYSAPEWSPDGAWLFVRAQYYEGSEYALLATQTSSPEPNFLSRISPEVYGSEVQWATAEQALLFSSGGPYGRPHLTLVEPGATPTLTSLLDIPVQDAEMRADGRIVFLRSSGAPSVWPTSVRLYSALSSGGGLRVESRAFILERALLSPDGVMIAGLLEMRYNESGVPSGLLAIANPGTGELYVIQGVSGVQALQWAPGTE